MVSIEIFFYEVKKTKRDQLQEGLVVQWKGSLHVWENEGEGVLEGCKLGHKKHNGKHFGSHKRKQRSDYKEQEGVFGACGKFLVH